MKCQVGQTNMTKEQIVAIEIAHCKTCESVLLIEPDYEPSTPTDLSDRVKKPVMN